MILQHETAHVRQLHWIDLLIIEIVHCILWFNPVLIFYKRALKLQHEYLADAWTLRRGVSIPEYLHCLLRQIETANGIHTASYFYSQTIKKRITMMTTNRTSRKLFPIYLLAGPLISLLLFSFSSSPDWDRTLGNSNGAQISLIIDAGHGGSDVGAMSEQGLNEKDITLSVAKTLKALGDEQGITVVLTRNDDRTMSLQERANVSRGVKAVAFISLHLNSHSDLAHSGIECMVSKNGSHSANSLRLANELTGQLRGLKGINVNGIKEADTFVLTASENPAVILELGFLTNNGDYNFIKDQSNQRAVCNKIIAGVKQFTK
jgi:N-acetylmuramoyl-L-alanine amidase